MQALPWLPRPLIIFAMIGETLTPCVQWHGQDSEGNITEEQMLFPLYGHDAQFIETIKSDFWRVSFLGEMGIWNERYPKTPYARVKNGKAEKGSNGLIARIIANELFEHDTFALTCFAVQVEEWNRLYAPATYDNRDAYDELPRHDVDRDLQANWRNFYRGLGRVNVQEAVEGMYPGYPGRHAQKYAQWLKERRRLDEAFFNDYGPSEIRY